MQVPPEITFRDVLKTDELESFIGEQIAKLNRFAEDMVSCRVTVEHPQKHQESGAPYGVRIEATLPQNKYLVVSKNPGDFEMHTKLRTVVRRAFQAMERQLQQTEKRRRGEVKTHEAPRRPVARKRRAS
jgi:ribosome-associated translation inhibitor RaiA